ncbi:YoaK family protein [Kitasatospora sp. NPDC002227]|uniref:YoaK family protein n=1 Tax=Kitasatospora sp. NPDC002227 TaxID=3154773 RepID=UPI00332EEAEC
MAASAVGTAGRPEPVPRPQLPDSHPLVLSLFALTVVSGLIDAVSYLGLGHVFAANMTGNVVVVGFALAGAPGFSVLGSTVALAAFLLGAGLAGRVAGPRSASGRGRRLRVALVLEVVLHGAAAVGVFAWGTAGAAQYVLVAVLALAMGLRTGIVRTLGVPDLTTTVLTMTLAGLAADSRPAGGAAPRQRRRAVAVAAMVAGAASGAVLVRHGQAGWALVSAAGPAGVTFLLYRE